MSRGIYQRVARMSDKNDYVNHMHTSCQVDVIVPSGSPFEIQIRGGTGGNSGVNVNVGPSSTNHLLKIHS